MKKEIKIPTLRFPAFSDLWQQKLLEDIAIRGSGHTPDKSYPTYYNGGIKWISLADSKRLDNGYIEETNIEISTLGIKKSSAVLHPKESVLLSRDAGVGKSAVMKVEMAVSQHFIVWQAKENQLNNWFLYYKLQILKPEFERIATGNTIKTIGLPYFKKLKINIPLIAEQIKIANFLTTVDDKIIQLKKKKSLLEQFKKGVMQKLFSQSLRFKEEDGQDFPDWKEMQLQEVFYAVRGKGLSKDMVDCYGKNECILYGELYTKYNEVVFTVHSRTNCENGVKSKIGDLLIPTSTTTSGIDLANATALNKNDVLLGGDITILRCNLEIVNVFYAYYLTNFKKQEIANLAQGSTIVHLYYSHIKDIKIDYPSIKEQTKIANFLSAIDDKMNHCSMQIEKMETWKKGLLQKMFC